MFIQVEDTKHNIVWLNLNNIKKATVTSDKKYARLHTIDNSYLVPIELWRTYIEEYNERIRR